MPKPRFAKVRFASARFAEHDWVAHIPGVTPPKYFLKIGGENVAGWCPTGLELLWSEPSTFSFYANKDWNFNEWNNNTEVEFLYKSKIIFKGKIMSNNRRGDAKAPFPIYTALDNIRLLGTVPVKINGSLNVVINPEPGEPEYGVHQVEKTTGQVIREIFDALTTELAGIWDHVVQEELDALTARPPRIEMAGKSVYQALMALLKYEFDIGFKINYEDNTLHFQSIAKSKLITRNITLGTAPIANFDFNKTVLNSISRVLIQGRREIEQVDYISYLSGTTTPDPAAGSTITKRWDSGDETDWDAEKWEDDPARADKGQVYANYTLSHQNLLPGLILGQSPITIAVFDPDTGALGNWSRIGGQINCAEGLLRLTSPAWKTVDDVVCPMDMRCRYAYVDNTNPLETDTGHQGSAYTKRGWKNTLAIYEPDYKYQVIKGIVTGWDAGNGLLKDATGQFSDKLIGKSVNGAAIIDAGDGWIKVSGGSFTVGDTYTIPFRDDTTAGLDKVGQAILNVYGDEQYVGMIVLNDLDHENYPLGTKINLLGSDEEDLETMDVPLKGIRYDFLNYTTTLLCQSGYFFQGRADFDELKRRLTSLVKKNRSAAYIDVSVAASTGGGESGAAGKDKKSVPEHDHSSTDEGGDSIKPKICWITDELNIMPEGYRVMMYSVEGAKIIFPYRVAVIAGNEGGSDFTMKEINKAFIYVHAKGTS